MAELILDAVTKRFAQTPVVNEVSLKIEPGTFVALLGPSGCGKTTVLRMIAGFERVDAGRILLDGQVLSSAQHYTPPEQRQMSMVFQSYALWPHMNVADNIGYALKLKKISGRAYEDQVNEALEAVNMQGLAKRMPSELSGGQRQRVALARCLVSAPKVVLLDEPLANLDQHLRASMEQTFREFHQRTGAIFIYVTHDQAEAMALADKIAVMHQGKIVQYDTPENLYRQPETEWTARFIGQGSILYSTTEPVRSEPASYLRGDQACITSEYEHDECVTGLSEKQAHESTEQEPYYQEICLNKKQSYALTEPEPVRSERELVGTELMAMLKVAASPSSYTHSILVRPQHIRVIAHDSVESKHSLHATIRERSFKGERYHYQADVLGNQTIAFYNEHKIAIGESVQLLLERGYLLRG
ncbi:MAG: ABC transporter ATP-binding protein [Pelistega sp.]|nr:ABC transporter ATP-binding protein [Pelistega sp.]